MSIQEVVDHLRQQRAAVLRAWQQAVEADPILSTASQLTRTGFLDGIPRWLDSFEAQLLSLQDILSKSTMQTGEEARQHGSHRWEQGYNLFELTREWGHLQLCLSDEIEQFFQSRPQVDAGLMQRVRRTLMQAINEGINQSATQYHQIQQSEAVLHAQDLEAALAQVNTLERLRGEALREASHDLRGGLTLVQGAAGLLERIPDEHPAARDQVLDMVQRGVTSLHRMISDLMDLARLEAGQEQRTLKPFDAAVLLQELCDSLQPIAAERHLFLQADGPAMLSVEGDEIKVRRIAQNLLLNALKYTVEGGVQVSWNVQDSDHWLLIIQDSGPGLNLPGDSPVSQPPPGQAERRLTARQGEGIGLSIVKRLCELLDARLQVQSSSETGTRFHILLPRHYK